MARVNSSTVSGTKPIETETKDEKVAKTEDDVVKKITPDSSVKKVVKV